MLRAILAAVGLIALWTLIVAAAVLIEAAFFAEPDVRRGDVSSIQNHFNSHLERVSTNRSLGAATVVLIHNGDIVFERGYGVGNEVDVEQTLFQVGSVSKAVTAFGVMRLVQEGRIGLDEPVINHLKRWRFAANDERKDRVTVRQLLSHTGGVEDPSHDADKPPGERVQTLEEYLSGRDGTSGVRISHEPGTAFVYGNSATGILQLLIEDITGQEFSVYMRENVLIPLGMTHSTFDLSTAMDRLAPAFDARVNEQSPRRHPAPAAVALYTSGRDLARFAHALADANAVLNESTMQMVMTPAPATGGGWGLGVALFTPNDAGGYVAGHDGGARPSWGAVVRSNPATRNGLVMTVSGGSGSVNQLEHDWVFWETGKLTPEAHRQVAFGRASEAGIALLLGICLIGLVGILRYRKLARTRS